MRPVTKGGIFAGFICMKCPEWQNLWRQKVDQGLLRAESGEDEGIRVIAKGYEVFLRLQNYSKIGGDGYTYL